MEELFKYLNMIQRRRCLFLVLSLLAMTILIGASYHVPKKYKAESTVFIEKNVITNLVKDIAVTPDMNESIRVIRYALLSRGMIKRALEKISSFEMPESDTVLYEIAESLSKRTEVQVNKDELFIVSITDPNPVFAYEYINALVKSYVEDNLSGNRDETYGASRFLDEQLVYFQGKLGQAEDAIIEFRKKHGVFSTSGDGESLQELREYQREVKDIELALEEQGARKRQSLLQLKKLQPNISVFNENDQVDRVVLLDARLQQLLITYNEDYPEIVRLKAEIESLRQAGEANNSELSPSVGATMPNPVYHEVQQNVFDLESEISSLQSRKKHLQKRMVLLEKDLQGTPVYKKELNRLFDEAASSRRVYEQLLMSAGQSEVSKQMELSDKTTTFRIVDAAILPRTPVSPNMVRMILMSIAAGLLIGGGIIIVLETAKKKVIGTDEIRALGYIILGTIPTILDPVSVAKTRKKDIMVYGGSIAYFSLVVGVLIYELILRFTIDY